MRYNNQEIFINDREAYQRFLEKTRGIKHIRQYSTPSFKHPTASEIVNFNRITHIWTTGDRFFKLADKYYHDPTKWWVIALYNQKPTEFHLKLGDTLYIPVPLEAVLYYMGL